MSGQKKPCASTPAPAAQLTADQLRVAQLFAQLSDDAQPAMLDLMQAMARDCPRRARPTLRLVGGGAK